LVLYIFMITIGRMTTIGIGVGNGPTHTGSKFPFEESQRKNSARSSHSPYKCNVLFPSVISSYQSETHHSPAHLEMVQAQHAGSRNLKELGIVHVAPCYGYRTSLEDHNRQPPIPEDPIYLGILDTSQQHFCPK